MNVDGCALQCYELLRPVPLQEIPEHVEERRLHRWHQQMPIDQVPTYRLIRELDNATAPCILYVFYYLYISDVGPTSLTTRRWLRDNLFVDDATRLISIIIFFWFVCLISLSLCPSLLWTNKTWTTLTILFLPIWTWIETCITCVPWPYSTVLCLTRYVLF